MRILWNRYVEAKDEERLGVLGWLYHSQVLFTLRRNIWLTHPTVGVAGEADAGVVAPPLTRPHRRPRLTR